MLKEFIVSGKLGELALGNTKAEVHNLLGTADACTEGGMGMEIWKYGGLEVAFDADSTCFIGLYFERGIVVLPPVFIAGGLIKVQVKTLNEFKRYLSANDIEFKVDQSLTFDDQTCLRTLQSGVGVYFNRGDLHSVQLSEVAIAPPKSDKTYP